jgi:PKD repeat protein
VSPSGARLYVANKGSNSITRFAIAADGSLSGAVTTPTGDGTAPDALGFTPDGRFLYSANSGLGTISIYSVGAADGSLSAVGTPAPAGTAASAPAALVVSPSGASLYASLAGDNKVAGWTISATGALTPLDASPYASGPGARGIAISPDGTRLLAANPGDGTISRFTVSTDGVLTARQDAAPTLTGAQSVAIAPDGNHAYVGGSAAVAAYDLSATAGLQAHGAALTTNGNHGSLAIAPDLSPQARLDPSAAPAGSASNFQGGGSTDQDGTVAGWHWDFGDGSTADGASVSHTYASPGSYTVRLTVTDNDGCSVDRIYTGQSYACVGSAFATTTRTLDIAPATVVTTPDPPCIHDGDDGYCGTPDLKAPQAAFAVISEGASIAAIDAPDELVGTISNDPSGIKSVQLRFSKAAGTITKKKTVRKRVCRKVRGKRKCRRRKVVKKTNTKVPACLTVSGTKTYLVKYVCSKVPWITIQGDSIFRYTLPVVLGTGAYTVDVLATDGSGNADVLEPGRNHVTFKIVRTPTTVDTTGGGTTTPTTTTPSVDDTGSPFGSG